MITFKQFLEISNFPSEEDFNETIKALPPFNEIDKDSVPFDSSFDYLGEWLFVNGFLYSLNLTSCDFEYFSLEDKKVSVTGINSLEDLNKLNKELTCAGWELENYEDEKSSLEEYNEDIEKELWWNQHKDEVSIEDLKQLTENDYKERCS